MYDIYYGWNVGLEVYSGAVSNVMCSVMCYWYRSVIVVWYLPT
jgi:hypothetical protein